jgi:AraC-like DNA-binding protein
MPAMTLLDLNIRSYREDHGPDSHAFDQLVLPLSGALELEISGQGGRLAPGRAAFVSAGARHSTMSDTANRSIILDVHLAASSPAIAERLGGRPFVNLSPAAMKLIDYMGLMLNEGRASTTTVSLWTPLLIDALSHEPSPGAGRLAKLLAQVEAEPAAPWTAAMMAERASVSVSRLHALFRAELASSPRAWLSDMRLQRARNWLATSNQSIAQIAHSSGYGDQSALTRAMRKATGMTPAAYRREQEPRPKTR